MVHSLTTADQRDALMLRRGWRGKPVPTATSWLWAWLVAAMLLAQSLGLMHNVLHTAAPQGVHAGAALPAGPHEDAGSSWLARLFSGHDNASDCRLYDQVSHGDGIPTAALLQLPALQPLALTQVMQALAPAKPTIRLQARGPPTFS
jgi:hypothetical protein